MSDQAPADDLSLIVETIHDGLDAAARIINASFRKPVPVEIKDDESPVTHVDRAAEQVIREIIGTRFPNHAIFGEEQGQTDGKGGTWVIDPIDGTKSFLFGSPLFGTLIGFVRDDAVLAGGLAMPALGETWMAERNGPTLLNGDQCRVSNCRDLSGARLLTSSPDFFDPDEQQRFEALSQHVQYRRFGGDCYTYAQVAGGWADLVVESSLYPFDYLALVPIVEQAGGAMTDWEGKTLGLHSGRQVIAAATKELHQQALDVLNGPLPQKSN